MHARVSVTGPTLSLPVVLVHGWGVSSRYMVPIARRLGVTRQVYAPDFPGHGRSDRPPRALDVPALADMLASWMDAAKIGRAALLGNSMGCQVIVDFASRFPDRTDRVVLVGPTLDDAARSLARHALRLLADIPFERPALLPVVVLDYVRMGPRLLLQELRHMVADHELEKMSLVRAPALVVRGARDAVVPREWAQTVADALRAGTVREVRRWGHALNFSAPEALARIVEPFLDGVER